VCTLRAAIQEANACLGSQTIKFSAPMQIYPATALPALTDKGTVIDGSDQWLEDKGPGIVLEGNSGAFSGLEIAASNCAVYGLTIRNFGRHGVYLHASFSAIGGVGHRGNMIYGNGWHGVSMEGSRNLVAGNLIAANGWSGIGADWVDGYTQISNNRIGLSVDGQPLGNGFYGIHLAHGSRPVVISNTIAYNKRGIYLEGGSIPWIYRNTIYGHNASASNLTYPGYGGGIFCYQSAPVIAENVITNNVAYTGTDKIGYGGGIALLNCDETLIGSNTVVSNMANTTGQGKGGGISLRYSDDVLVADNTIMSNTAGADPESRGGGLYLEYSNTGPHYHIVGNTIRGNSAAADGRGYGGGVRLFYSNATLDSNFILGNRATFGGGVDTANSTFFTMTNNILAQNSLNGVYTWASPGPSCGLLVHNTIAQNGSSGVSLSQNSALTLTNNIIVSHTTGIYATPGHTNTVVADYTLFYGNTRDTDGGVITSTHAITGRDPLFVDPVGWNYHLRAGSPAVDAGIAVPWLTWDIDGDPRPLGAGYDIGADEARFLYLPLVLRNY
jgi:parallel beta-helix repeat protein